MLRHLDLFSGIGGFALATEMVWKDVEHTFVEYDPFCQEILKKHWPGAEIRGDIRAFVTNANVERRIHGKSQKFAAKSDNKALSKLIAGSEPPFLLTGGFPCQPFSQAGRRKGTDDNRYLWPTMLECIALFRPRWVIAENVAGLITWNNGMVLETVCADLEKEGYEVQPFVIPAAAVGAPHRRDRIWFVGRDTKCFDRRNPKRRDMERDLFPKRERKESADETHRPDSDAGANTEDQRLQGIGHETYQQRSQSNDQLSDGRSGGGIGTYTERARLQKRSQKDGTLLRSALRENRDESWDRNWIEVAATLCRVDDGIPRRLDRTSRLKALGNAIVPQVAAEIMRAIAESL